MSDTPLEPMQKEQSRKVVYSGRNLLIIPKIPKDTIHLDLSNNSLTNLDSFPFHTLTDLEYLDISNNPFEDLTCVFDRLKECNRLRTLFISCFYETERVLDLFNTFRWVEYINHVRNPALIPVDPADPQRMALDYLWKRHEISANNLSSIRIPTTLERSTYWSTILALSELVQEVVMEDGSTRVFGPSVLYIRVNNVPEHRFLTIHFVPSVQFVLGESGEIREIHYEERENASRMMDTIQRTKQDLYKDSEISSYNRQGRISLAGLQLSERILVSTTPGAQSETVNFDYIEQHAESMELLQSFETALYYQSGTFENESNFVSRFEILVHSLQIFLLILPFQLPHLPLYWFQIYQWLKWIQLDIHFYFPGVKVDPFILSTAQYATICALPVLFGLMYLYMPDYAKWRRLYIKEWSGTVFRYIAIFLFANILSCLLGYICDTVYTLGTLNFVNGSVYFSIRTLWFYCVFIGVFLVFAVPHCIIVLYFRRYNHIQHFYRIQRTRQRVALFLLTITFMPVIQTLFGDFLKRLRGYPDKIRVDLSDPFLYTSGILSVLYIITIPVALAGLIRKNVRILDTNFQFREEETAIRDLRDKAAMYRRTHDSISYRATRKDLREREDRYRKRYTYAVNNYKSASTYLYAPYQRPSRYYKVTQFVERVSLVAVSFFLAPLITTQPLWILPASFTGILSAGWFVALFQNPYTEWPNRIAHFVGISNNLVLSVLTLLTAYGWRISSMSLGLTVANVVYLGVHALNVFYSPIYNVIGWYRYWRRIRETNVG